MSKHPLRRPYFTLRLPAPVIADLRCRLSATARRFHVNTAGQVESANQLVSLGSTDIQSGEVCGQA